MLARLVGWAVHAKAYISADIIPMFAMGLRFDLKVLASIWIVPWLLATIFMYFRPASLPTVNRWARKFFFLQLILINFVVASNFLYQGYYGTPFSPAVFGLIDDDTWVVVLTIWKDLPVVRTLLLVAAVSWLQGRLLVSIETRFDALQLMTPRPMAAILSAVITLFLFAFILRGRLGSHPINADDFQVSPNGTISDLVPNGAISLYYAWRDYRNQTLLTGDPATALKAAGYATPAAAAAKLGIFATDESVILQELVRKTPKNLIAKEHPPHVVVVLFESWGAQALQRNSSEIRILGRLEKYIDQDYWFPRFVSSRRATHPTLESLLINSPITPLSQGRHGEIDYLTAAARPFKDAGYRTIFMYGHSARWRALHRAMPHLGFDEVLDLSNIQQRYPEATTSSNGVHDEFLYRLAAERLVSLDKQGQPAMIFMLTTTNHTPYVRNMMPPTYVPQKVDLAKFSDTILPPEESEIALQGFRYASDQLGAFVDSIASSPINDHTIIAATGDHYLRYFFRQDDKTADQPWMDRVGFYLRIPEAYKVGAQFNSQEFGGHRDIFPTLYRRSLSEARYFAYGDDLLSPERTDQRVAIGDLNNVYLGDEVALTIKSPSYYHWDAKGESLIPSLNPSSSIRNAVEREHALAALQDWVIRLQANGFLKSMPNSLIGPGDTGNGKTDKALSAAPP